MDSAQHIVKLGPERGRTGRPHDDRAGARQPGVPPGDRDARCIGEPAAILLVEFSGDDRGALLRQLQQLVELMGDLGLPGSVVEMPDEAPQKALWEVRKAGLNIMMCLKGDGKPVSASSRTARCRWSTWPSTPTRLTEVFARHGTRGTWYAHASVGTLHVRPILDMRRDGAAKMRAIAEEASALVRAVQGRLLRRARRRPVPRRVDPLAVRPGAGRRAARDQAAPGPDAAC